jgi:hypothetical protein
LHIVFNIVTKHPGPEPSPAAAHRDTAPRSRSACPR